MHWKKHHGFLSLILISGVIVAWRFGFILAVLDKPLVLDEHSDGFKTYMNAIYHARFDPSNSLFGGMNYPYQEHIVAATELPGLALLIKSLSPYFPSLPDYTFGLTHLLLILSVWLCAIFLFLILKEFSLPDWYAILVAIGLTFLSPQNFRFVHHMGLAPLFVVPAVLYGLIRLTRSPSFGKSLFLTSIVFLSALLHFYFFAICELLIGLYFGFSFLQNRRWDWLKKNLKYYAVIWLLPTAVFLQWMILKDPVQDRSAKPWGFLVYRSKWEGLFTFHEFPLWNWVDQHIIPIEKVEFEGWAYVGLVATIFVHIGLVRWLWARFKQPILPAISKEHRLVLMPILGAAVVLVFLACSQPFATKGFESLLQYCGPLRQFRSTGRFAWVFYYSINIIAFTSLFHGLAKKSPWFRGAGISLLLSVLAYEAWEMTYNKHMDKPLLKVSMLQTGGRMQDLTRLDFEEYQAILPVPYYNVGSNNFGAKAGGNILQYSLAASAQTGLPLIGAMLTRSSRFQAYQQLQLVAKPYQVPSVFKNYPNQKPLIVLASNYMAQEDSLRYAHLLDANNLLYKGTDFNLYKLALGSFETRMEARKKAIVEQSKNERLYQIGDFRSTDSLQNFYYDSFEHFREKAPHDGSPVFQGPVTSTNSLFNGELPNKRVGEPYELICKFYINEDRYSASAIKITEQGKDGGKINEKIVLVGQHIVEFGSDGWVILSIPFELKSPQGSLNITLSMEEPVAGKWFKLDDLLIKPVATDLYKFKMDAVWWNCRSFQ